MKKIIFFSKNLSIGGMEISLVNLVNKLSCYYDVTLVLTEKQGELLEKLNDNINVTEYKMSNISNVFIRKIDNFIKRFCWIIKNYNKYDFSCNYATYLKIGSVLALASSKNNMLYVHSNYYDYYFGDENKIKEFFGNIKLKKFKAVAFVSNESKNNLLKIYKNKENFIVLPNIFDYERYHIEKVKPQKDVFLFLGRLDDTSKKLYRLFDAFKNTKDTLWVVGNGADKENYVHYVKKNKINNVEFYNGTTDVSYYLNRCSYVVLASDYEGFPVVYTEAIYFKKPILTTVKTSNTMIDISDYSVIVDKNVNDIIDGIKKIKKIKICYDLNFEKYNSNIIEKFRSIIR